MTIPLLTDKADLATALDILDKWVAHQVEQRHQPGLAIGVVYDGALLWGAGYGFADMETGAPVTLDTRFRIASITKTFTATATLQLRDAGALSLDDPVSRHLDWFDLRYRDAPAVTIRNLLTHTAGLPRDSVNPMWTECEAPSWAAFVADTQARKATRPPYEKFAYSNLGYSLLGGIIAAASGQPWADYLQRHVLDPLGMSETRPLPSADDPLLATGYTREKAGYQRAVLPFWLMNGFEASANFASSVNDLVKYAGFHLGGSGHDVLSPYTLTDMHRVHWLDDGWKSGYGLGMGLYRIKDWVISGHGGGYPGYLTDFTICRAHKTGVIVLTNSLGSDPHSYVKEAYKIVLPEIIKATAEAPPEARPEWKQYLGEYESDWARGKVIIRGGKLQVINLDAIDAPAVTLVPTEEEGVFTLCEAGQSNETLRFELDAEGNVARMWERGEYSIPVGKGR
ncbi:MAG: serine hydrolase [Chloroflexota bacterium]|nr:serine hydrolase [Chloroflexota bacterium]